MSEAERPDRIDPAHEVSVDDIRALAGPVTPHFALQVRNRIRRLIGPLPREDPARLERLAQYSGDPRGIGPIETEE